MYNNQFGAPSFYGNNFMTGQQYNAIRKPRFTNPLTEEDRKLLQSRGKFSLHVDEYDEASSKCTHRDQNGLTIVENQDGSFTCNQCFRRFNLVEMKLEDVQMVTSQFLDILESTKAFYLDMPPNVVTEIFQMIPFVEKIPQIYKMALDNFNSYSSPLNTPYTNGNQTFGMYDALNNPGFMFNTAPSYGFQQPMYNQYQNQPFNNGMYQQPMFNNQMQAQSTGIPNGAQMAGGFGYMDNGMPVGAAQAQVTQQQPQSNVAPTPFSQPNKNPQETIEQTKTFSV